MGTDLQLVMNPSFMFARYWLVSIMSIVVGKQCHCLGCFPLFRLIKRQGGQGQRLMTIASTIIFLLNDELL